MLGILLTISLVSCVTARRFDITSLHVPLEITEGHTEVEVECRYDADFTLLNWFKGPTEFLRYKPGDVPSIKTFAVLGVGKIEVLACGLTVCRLRLASLTEEATGLYRCDIERDIPPYRFETRTAHMTVRGVEHRRPSLQGLSDEYGEGDEIQVHCRGAEGSELRWYVNGREVIEMRGSATLQRSSSRLIFMGVPPTVSVQCAEFHNGTLLGSREAKAKFRDTKEISHEPAEQRNYCANIDCLGPRALVIVWVIVRLVR